MTRRNVRKAVERGAEEDREARTLIFDRQNHPFSLPVWSWGWEGRICVIGNLLHSRVSAQAQAQAQALKTSARESKYDSNSLHK